MNRTICSATARIIPCGKVWNPWGRLAREEDISAILSLIWARSLCWKMI